jgi:hypothetical protein
VAGGDVNRHRAGDRAEHEPDSESEHIDDHDVFQRA